MFNFDHFDMGQIEHTAGGYCVDIVMCIDATGSMTPIIDKIKADALRFHEEFSAAMERVGKNIKALRVKVIVFRDYICDTEAMKESAFFELPAEKEAFRRFVDGIQTCGGGDTPENAKEALAFALKSNWVTDGAKRRHVVVLFTDAPALELGARRESGRYPSGMPADDADLQSWWEGDSQIYDGNYESVAGRLVPFVPEDDSWKSLATWENCWPQYAAPGEGLREVDMDEVYKVLVRSCTAQQ